MSVMNKSVIFVLTYFRSLEVMSIQHRNDIEKSTWRTHQYFIDFESRIDMELSTSNRCHLFQVDSTFINDEVSTNFRRGISMSSDGKSTKLCPLGNLM